LLVLLEGDGVDFTEGAVGGDPHNRPPFDGKDGQAVRGQRNVRSEIKELERVENFDNVVADADAQKLEGLGDVH